MQCEKVAVAGLGLIGTSIAQGLTAGFARTVVGYDPERGARTDAATYVTNTTGRFEDLRSSDILILAAPPGQIPELLKEIAKWPPEPTAITDVASVKSQIIATAPKELRQRFVPGHPMAGNDSSGSELADAEMFHGAKWVLCPFPETLEDHVLKVRAMVRHLKATPVTMSAADHDKIAALLSHLPHVIASALLNASESLGEDKVSAKSWADMTRVGGSNPPLWADILIANRKPVLEAFKTYEKSMGEFIKAIEKEDRGKLEGLILRARDSK
jgi:prephenate dehydrogenase